MHPRWWGASAELAWLPAIFISSKQLGQQTKTLTLLSFLAGGKNWKKKEAVTWIFPEQFRAAYTIRKCSPSGSKIFIFLNGRNKWIRSLSFVDTIGIFSCLPHTGTARFQLKASFCVTQVLFSGRCHMYQMGQMQFCVSWHPWGSDAFIAYGMSSHKFFLLGIQKFHLLQWAAGVQEFRGAPVSRQKLPAVRTWPCATG